jgi:hypothetical protein
MDWERADADFSKGLGIPLLLLSEDLGKWRQTRICRSDSPLTHIVKLDRIMRRTDGDRSVFLAPAV